MIQSKFLSVMKHLLIKILTACFLLVASGMDVNGKAVLENSEYELRLSGRSDLIIIRGEGSARTFTSDFTVLFTTKNPEKAMRRPDVGLNQEEVILYKVPTWGREELKEIDPTEHVMDGFDPTTDRELEDGRTANYYLAAPNEKLQASSAELLGSRITWSFPSSENYELSATVRLPEGKGAPELSFKFIPKVDGYFSVGYTGAPRVNSDWIDEMWQPLIWQEKRFPNLPYLTEAFLCPLPTALVAYEGVTVGVLADPVHLPFMPLPNSENSQFGIMVRDNAGMAQPALFAPVLGGIGSRMKTGEVFEFKAHLICQNGTLLETYEAIARDTYQFRDHRRNATVSLNTTFENMMDYNMGPFSMFVPELRGNNYATDVPGAVKNITGLHPLSLALITDNEDIYEERARPMIEYGFSRERFLFATNPEINRDGTSARLEGPGVPMSDFTTVYTYSQNRMGNSLDQAVEIYETPINRSLNLTAQLYGDRWQNALYLYNATGEKSYLETAMEGADKYLKSRVEQKAVDFMDPDSRGMFFWTSYVPQWMELYLLYEATGEARYLDAAHEGARRYTQFTWLAPVIPDEQVTVNIGGKVPRYRSNEKYKDMLIPEETVEAWRVSEIGLTPESSPTSHGHRGIYLAQYAPWMLRIARDGKDPLLHDVARSAIIGRYESFPGYHINAGRTTSHEKADFAMRPLNELNGVTSIHYNHPWAHAALLMDYLVSDVYYKSDGQLDFPAEYAEGYAYCRSKVYGAKPGVFYDGSEMTLFMPKGLVQSSNRQINYLAARGDKKLYLILTNQSPEKEETTLSVHADDTRIQLGQKCGVNIWQNNKRYGESTLEVGTITVEVPENGLTVVEINGIAITPVFQSKLASKPDKGWEKDRATLPFGGETNALLFNFRPELQSVYSYTKANGDIFKKVTFHYANDGDWKSVSKAEYPFEFTVEVPKATEKFRFYYEAVTVVDGSTVKSREEYLMR